LIFLSGARVVWLILQQLAARRQLVAAHRSNVLDAPLFIHRHLFACPKSARLVKSQIVHRDHLGSRAQRDAVPAQQAGNFQVARLVHHRHQDQRSRDYCHQDILSLHPNQPRQGQTCLLASHPGS
jgi:hypothetical protein